MSITWVSKLRIRLARHEGRPIRKRRDCDALQASLAGQRGFAVGFLEETFEGLLATSLARGILSPLAPHLLLSAGILRRTQGQSDGKESARC
jgi:hypothetical protein